MSRKLTLISIVCVYLLLACEPKVKVESYAEKLEANADKMAEQKALATPVGPALPFFSGKNFDLMWPDAAGSFAQDPISVPSFQFRNQRKLTLTEADIKAKVSVFSFFFTHCSGYCPMIIKNMKAIQKAFANDVGVAILSISVTPDLDSPEKLAEYASDNKITATNWHLLTGDREKIYALARETFQADTKTARSPGEDDFVHSENVYLVDENLRLRGIYNANSPSVIRDLIKDMGSLRGHLSVAKLTP